MTSTDTNDPILLINWQDTANWLCGIAEPVERIGRIAVRPQVGSRPPP